MKKIIISIVAALCISTAATAQSLSVADVAVVPGTTASYGLSINVGDGEYSGFQYEITFPATDFSTPDAGKSTVNASWEGGSVNPGALTGGTGKVSVLSMQNVKLPTGDFAVGTISFSVDSEVPVGSSYDVTISNIEFLSTTTRKPAPDITFTVSVVDKMTVVLDEESTEPPADATGVNVNVKRTINANEWSTICLPFTMTAEQVTAAFGSGVQLAKFSSWSSEKDGSNAIVGINVGFETVTAIEPNVPLLIKTSADISEFTADGVDIAPLDEPVLQVGKKSGERGYMYGNYVNGFKVPEENVFLSGGKFYYSVGNTSMMAYRGYFKFDNVLDAYYDEAPSRINIVIDGVATGIELNRVQSGNDRYYNLSGQQVERPTKGLYISNGQKVVMK